MACCTSYADHCFHCTTRFRDRPQAMCFQLRDALKVGCIGLYKNFFCNSMEVKEVLKLLDDELRNFCVLIEPPKTPFGKGARRAPPPPRARRSPARTARSQEDLQRQGRRPQRRPVHRAAALHNRNSLLLPERPLLQLPRILVLKMDARHLHIYNSNTNFDIELDIDSRCATCTSRDVCIVCASAITSETPAL